MATRPIFIPDPDSSLVNECDLEFKWFPGQHVSQKQRSIESLHQSAAGDPRVSRVLEVSTKSPESLGKELSAFNLSLDCDARPDPILLEAAFQGSKVFAARGFYPARGPHTDLYSESSGRKVKQFMKRFSEDEVTEFRFDDHAWPLTPRTAFYDWLYIKALRQRVAQGDRFDEALLKYDAFTDIEFNPKKSFNCQARSCALYVALLKNGSLSTDVNDPDRFIRLLEKRGYPGRHDDSDGSPQLSFEA